MTAGSTAVRFHRTGGVEVLQVDPVEAPRPSSDEIAIRVKAFALNRADLMFIEGAHYTLPLFPSRIGSEAVGIVEAVGDSVTEFVVGDRVSTLPFHSQTHGVHGEYATVPARYVRAVPAALSDVQACAVWMQYLTAYFALAEVAYVGPGDTVLITAAASSAGLGAVQIAGLLGARAVATVRSEHKAGAVRAVGADRVLVVGNEDEFASPLMDLTQGAGVRVVFDPIGGDSLARYVDALALDAVVIGYGALSGANPVIPVAAMVRRAAIFHPYSMFNHVTDPDQLGRAQQFIETALAEGALAPVIDRVFDYSEVLDAYGYMTANTQAGKIVVRVSKAG